MQEIIQSFFKERSLVNHQLASYDDCIPAGDNNLSRMEKIIRNIRVGTDEEIDDDDGGFIKLDVVDQDITIRLKNIQLGEPTIREANGAEHPSTPMECRLRKLTYMSPVTIDFQIFRNGVRSPKEEAVQVGSMPIMVRSKRCNLHAGHIAGDRQLYPTTSTEDSALWDDLLRKKGEDPLDPGGYFIINGTERVLISMEDLAPNRVTVEINKRYAKRTEVAKIFSQKDGMRKPLNVEKRRDGMLMVKISTAGTTAIPVVLLMRALGIENDQEVFQAIAGPTETFKYIVANLNEVNDNEEYGVQNKRRLTNGCRRNSQPVNNVNTESNGSTNCSTVNFFLTWVTNQPLVRRRLSSLAASFVKSSKWPSPTVSQTTRTTTQTSVFVSQVTSWKICSVCPLDNSLVT